VVLETVHGFGHRASPETNRGSSAVDPPSLFPSRSCRSVGCFSPSFGLSFSVWFVAAFTGFFLSQRPSWISQRGPVSSSPRVAPGLAFSGLILSDTSGFVGVPSSTAVRTLCGVSVCPASCGVEVLPPFPPSSSGALCSIAFYHAAAFFFRRVILLSGAFRPSSISLGSSSLSVASSV